MNIYTDDFYIGKRFKYLGVKMLVVGFIDEEFSTHDGSMYVDYIDGNGTLTRHRFSDADNPAVISEYNRTGEQF